MRTIQARPNLRIREVIPGSDLTFLVYDAQVTDSLPQQSFPEIEWKDVGDYISEKRAPGRPKGSKN